MRTEADGTPDDDDPGTGAAEGIDGRRNGNATQAVTIAASMDVPNPADERPRRPGTAAAGRMASTCAPNRSARGLGEPEYPRLICRHHRRCRAYEVDTWKDTSASLVGGSDSSMG
jgi:hypothetical protein